MAVWGINQNGAKLRKMEEQLRAYCFSPSGNLWHFAPQCWWRFKRKYFRASQDWEIPLKELTEEESGTKND